MSERAQAPRSGGRTADRKGTERRTQTAASGTGITGARGARRYPAQPAATHGTAALKLDAARSADVASRPRLRVAPPAPISVPRAPFVAVVIALVVAGVLGILVINTKTNENSFRISKLQDKQTALDNQQQDLENQIAGYKSPGNLDAAARRLGLVKADNPAYIRLPDGKIIGVPKPGTGQPAVTAQDGNTTTTQNGTAQQGGTAQNGTAQQGGTVQNGTAQQGGTGQNGTVSSGDGVQNGAVAGAGQ